MTRPSTSLRLALLLAIGLPGTASLTHGQLPVSRQAAVLPVQVTGGGAVTPVAIPFTKEPVARDIVDAVSGQDITATGGGYTAGAFANTHVLLIVTGPNRGTALTITGNTATVITVSGTVPALANDSDEFEIVPLATVGSVFGDSTTGGPFDLTGNTNAATADILILSGSRYFYKTSGIGGAGWKLESAPNATGDLGNTLIPNLRGLNVLRRGATKLIGIRGVARNTRAVIPIATGTNLVSWPFPSEITLLNSGLQNSITGSSTASGADKVVVGGVRYFYKTSGIAAPGWKLESAPNGALPGANNVILNTGGTSFNILRSGAATGHGVLEQFTN